MEKEDIIRIRKELHNLAGPGRATLPIRVLGANADFTWSEADCCFIWDDDNETLYMVYPNDTYSSTDNRLFPMQIKAICYAEITTMSVPVDRTSLDNFFKDKVEKGLTNEKTRERYYSDMTKLWEPETYLMGQPSPTTEKRGMRPDDKIINKDATQFL